MRYSSSRFTIDQCAFGQVHVFQSIGFVKYFFCNRHVVQAGISPQAILFRTHFLFFQWVESPNMRADRETVVP